MPTLLLQETHSCDTDSKFWKSQWDDQVFFSHGSHLSAGVAILFHKFTGGVLENLSSDGRWIIIVVKLDNSVFLLCNVYGHNSIAQVKTRNHCLHIPAPLPAPVK